MAERQALLDAMAADDLDVLVLGRPANVLLASGANQLWTAGSRPFGPACVVVAATGRVHLLQTWDEGVPAEIGHDDLYGLSWNPANVAASLAAIPGLGEAHRVGTDSFGPGVGRLFGAVTPHAEVVDGRAVVRAARRTDVEAVLAATAVARAGLDAMVEALRPNITERQLLAVHVQRLAALGAPTPPTEGVACITARTGPTLRRVPSDRSARAGDLVVLDAGARLHGWEGGLGRTVVVGGGESPLADRARAGLAAVVAACTPGATGADLKDAWATTGEPLPPVLAHGVGLGMELPIVAAGVGDGEVLFGGTVLAVTSWVAEEGVGGHLERDLVLVGPTPTVLSREEPHG